MRLLVTGADGFVGRYLVRAAQRAGHPVIASILPTADVPVEWSADDGVTVVRADMREQEDVSALSELAVEAVVHLAAVASGMAARQDPEAAYVVNGGMTAFFADELSQLPSPPRFLFVSTAEVYGAGHDGPIPESAPATPGSPYAISKYAAEMALEHFWREEGFPMMIARAFPHSGPGQTTSYVLPALTARLKEAKRTGATSVRTGNLSGVRDFLDVRDVVSAYLLLLERGSPGESYNVASGVGQRLSDCFARLAELVGVDAVAAEDAALLRSGDIPVLIGDATKLRTTTGWTPQFSFERTLQDLVDAQAN